MTPINDAHSAQIWLESMWVKTTYILQMSFVCIASYQFYRDKAV